MPDWYVTIKAARLLGVYPEDLADKPNAALWSWRAIAAEQAEGRAARDRARIQ
jgi:hypothetical protein